MKKKLIVPKIGGDTKKGILCAWMKENGESYKKGEVIYEIETEKVVSSIEAEADGIFLMPLFEEGDEVLPGDEIAEIEENE